jgi:hypothetical protein
MVSSIKCWLIDDNCDTMLQIVAICKEVLEFGHNSHILLKNSANMKDKDEDSWILYIAAGNCLCGTLCKSLEPGLRLLFLKSQDI